MINIKETFPRQLNLALEQMDWDEKKRAAKLAEATGVSVVSAHKWLTGKSVPDDENLTAISRLVRKSPEWLFFGADTVEDISPYRHLVSVKVLSLVQTGCFTDINNVTDPIDVIQIDRAWIPNENCFVIRVNGDSMTCEGHPKSLNDGENIVVNPMISPNLGDVVVATADNCQATVKLYVGDEYNKILMPLNPRYQAINSFTFNGNECTIIGVVVNVIPQIRSLR